MKGKPCARCHAQTSLRYHPYCDGCNRASRGLGTRRYRKATKPGLCPVCNKRPAGKLHRYCKLCRRGYERKWKLTRKVAMG